MTCRDFVEFLLAYWENELAPEERRRFDAHLELCPHCVDYLESYRRTVALTAAAGDDAPPPDAPEDLIQAILASRA